MAWLLLIPFHLLGGVATYLWLRRWSARSSIDGRPLEGEYEFGAALLLAAFGWAWFVNLLAAKATKRLRGKGD